MSLLKETDLHNCHSLTKNQPKDIIFDKEFGFGADLSLARALKTEISAAWEIGKPTQERPFFLVMAGLQGSGKTSAIDQLAKKTDFITISSDEIRSRIYNQSDTPNKQKAESTITATRNALLLSALHRGQNIVVDQNGTPTRMAFYEYLLQKLKLESYNLVTAYLYARPEVLRERVANRQPRSGKYTGLVSELDALLAKDEYAHPDLSTYQLVFDTEQLKPEQIAAGIETAILPDINLPRSATIYNRA